MSKFLDILLQRNESNVPWGFSVEGGFDRKVAPFVSSVTFGTLASQYLNAGDRILQIQRQPAGGLLQSEIEKLLTAGGKNLQLMVEKTFRSRWSARVTVVREPEPAFLTFNKFHKEALKRQKRFLRMSESIIEDHFRRMRDLFDSSWPGSRLAVGKASDCGRQVLTGSATTDSHQAESKVYRRDDKRNSRKQQHQQAAAASPVGDGPQSGPPAPPPPPPSFPTALPGRRLKTEIPERGLEPPPAIQNAMLTKDKKPFTYTPGGIDLSEIKSPKMARRINRNACAEEMTGRPAPTTNQPIPTGPSPTTAYSAMQSQLPTSVLPSRGPGTPVPPPMPQSGAADGIPPPPPPPPVPSTTPAVATAPQVKPQAFHKPQQMGFDPNEILVRANRNQEAAPKRDMRQNSFGAETPRGYRLEDEPQKSNEVAHGVQKLQNEPGQIYVPPVTPKSGEVEAMPSQPPIPAVSQSPRGQLGSIYVPPVSNLIQEQSTPSPTSPFGQKLHSPSPAASSPMSPPTSAEPKSQLPWARSPQTTAPSWMSSQQANQRQPESPKPQTTRIIPIQIEGRDPPKPQYNAQKQQPYSTQQQQQYNTQQQQYNTHQQLYNTQSPQYNVQPQFGVQQDTRQSNRPQTRVIPIQIEGAASQSSPVPGQGHQNKFNPMTPTSPTPYTPPCADKEQKPQWAPVTPRPYTESPFGQQRVPSEPQRVQPQPEYGTYNTAGVPLSQLRKMQLSEDDRALMDKFKSQIEKHGNDAITDENANPRYRGGHIPSRVFKMLDESVDDETYLHRESDPRYRGPAIPSRAFRLLQNMTDTAGDIPQQVPKSPMRAPASRLVPATPEPPTGPYIPASEQEVQEPRKYTGGSIPSRSFRMLQAMTGQEITAQNHVKGSSSSGRSTPVPGMGRWCPSPVHPPPVDPYWYLYHSDPFLMYNYMPEMNAAYCYPPIPPPLPPGRYTPTHFQTYPSCMSDSDEQGYSSTDELGQYYANYRNRVGYSPFLRNPDPYYQHVFADEYASSRSSTPSIMITPVTGPKGRKAEYQESPLAKEIAGKKEETKVSEKNLCDVESESSSEEDSETDTDGEEETDISREINQSVQKICKSGTLQALKSASDVGIYASESTGTVTNEEEWEEGIKEKERDEDDDEEEEDEEEEESSESLREVSRDDIPHQLSVIFEESEHSDAESMRQKNSQNSTTKSITSESETSNAENAEEESDDDALDTESSVTVRLPLKLKFSRGENDEDVTTVIVGDSEVRRSAESDVKEIENEEEEEEAEEEEEMEKEDEEDADVSVTFSFPSRSNSVISVDKKSSGDKVAVVEDEKECDKPEKKESEGEAEVTVSFSLKKINKAPEEEQPNRSERRNSDRLSCDSKTEESDSTHFEDDSSSTSADTVVKHKEDTDEDETEKPEDVMNRMEDFKTWLNNENEKDWNEKTVELNKEDAEDEEEVSYKVGAGRLEKMICSMLEETKNSLDPEKKVKKENSQEESEDDSGVTSDMSAKHLAWETDGDTESDYSELSKMSQCQRASTHSRLFKLLQEECGNEETVEEEKSRKEPKLSPSSESLTQRKQRLSLPLNTTSEVDSLSSSSGVTSPSSPTVTDRLVKELVQSLLNKKKGKKFRKLPLARLHAAALRILQEDMDPYDTSSNSASGDDGFLHSPVQKTPHSPKTACEAEAAPDPKIVPSEMYGANYYDYLDYYNTWGNAATYYPESDHEIVPSKAFRMLSLQPNAMEGLKAKCPRIPAGGKAEERSKPSGRTTPCVTPRPETGEDDYSGLSFADKRDKVAKVLETAGKC